MIHAYEFEGFKIIIDSNSGAINIVDNIAYDILTLYKPPFEIDDLIDKFSGKYSEDDIKSAYKDIQQLINDRMLYSPELDSEKIIKKLNEQKGIKAICLHVAHDCNLMCEYCFASKGSYKKEKSLMSKETAFSAIDYLINNSGKRKNIEVDFFGGEPLLNFEVVKETVAYGRDEAFKHEKEIHFTITTNATLLDDNTIKFINENMDNVVVSLDGRREINDNIRYDALGNGTYDQIIKNAKKLVEARAQKSYFIRGTFTSKNTDFSQDVLHISDCGFREISVEPVVGAGDPLHLTEEDTSKVCEEYEKLARIYVERINEGKPFRFYHFNINIYGGPCIYKRITSCGAGTEYFAITPEGDIYPCHQFVGVDEFRMGNVIDEKSVIYHNESSDPGLPEGKSFETYKKFRNSSIFDKKECMNCWAKLFCSGGCHANAYFTNGDILKPSGHTCEIQKKRIECAVYCKAVSKE